MDAPGRTCPLAFRYRPEDLAGPPAFETDTLYVVGGLYGNDYALEAILRRAAAERIRRRAHWYEIRVAAGDDPTTGAR